MTIQRSATFKKQYRKLSAKLQHQFDARLKLFILNPTQPSLRIHPLKGRYLGYWSMNITGDIRALYRYQGQQIVIFALIGSHSELYG